MIDQKNLRWIKVAESTAEITQRGERTMMEVRVGGKEICIIYHQEKLFACTANCPHAGGKLINGSVDAAGNIACPLHRYRFQLKNGFNCSGEGYHLKTYPVNETEEGVFIGI
ncbi:MAG: Rieske 2Fe-2S domain-containing protein [Bacteroidota bacterium]